MMSFGIFRKIPSSNHRYVHKNPEGKTKYGGKSENPILQGAVDIVIKPGHSLLIPAQSRDSRVEGTKSLLKPGQSLLKPNKSTLTLSQSDMKAGQSLLKSPPKTGRSLSNPNKGSSVQHSVAEQSSLKRSGPSSSTQTKSKKSTASRKCVTCGNVFSNAKSLKKHRAEVHGDSPTFCCPVCRQGFMSRVGYTDHLTRHENVKRHECLICNTKFRYLNNLKRHSVKCRQR